MKTTHSLFIVMFLSLSFGQPSCSAAHETTEVKSQINGKELFFDLLSSYQNERHGMEISDAQQAYTQLYDRYPETQRLLNNFVDEIKNIMRGPAFWSTKRKRALLHQKFGQYNQLLNEKAMMIAPEEYPFLRDTIQRLIVNSSQFFLKVVAPIVTNSRIRQAVMMAALLSVLGYGAYHQQKISNFFSKAGELVKDTHKTINTVQGTAADLRKGFSKEGHIGGAFNSIGKGVLGSGEAEYSQRFNNSVAALGHGVADISKTADDAVEKFDAQLRGVRGDMKPHLKRISGMSLRSLLVGAEEKEDSD